MVAAAAVWAAAVWVAAAAWVVAVAVAAACNAGSFVKLTALDVEHYRKRFLKQSG